MRSIFYNPCADGFPAKVWECLRRNPQFVKTCEGIQDGTCEDEINSNSFGEGMVAERNGNAVARCAFEYGYAGNTAIPWPQQPTKFRERFSALFSDQTDLPKNNYEPQFIGSTRLPFIASELDLLEETIDLDVTLLEAIMEDHVLIAVPKQIRDSGHRDAIFEKLEQFVAVPFLKKLALKPTGKLLGSSKAWEVFLVWEHWADKIPSRGERLGICELYRSDRHSYDLAAKSGFKNLAPDITRLIEDHESRRGAALEKSYILPIEQGIQATFPIFEVFKDRGEINLAG
jgi:hypothetical protein